jgi:hypothetical protein
MPPTNRHRKETLLLIALDPATAMERSRSPRAGALVSIHIEG